MCICACVHVCLCVCVCAFLGVGRACNCPSQFLPLLLRGRVCLISAVVYSRLPVLWSFWTVFLSPPISPQEDQYYRCGLLHLDGTGVVRPSRLSAFTSWAILPSSILYILEWIWEMLNFLDPTKWQSFYWSGNFLSPKGYLGNIAFCESWWMSLLIITYP